MVEPQQFLERPALIDARGVWLEGLYHRGDRRPAVLICPPISAGPGMDAPAVAELAFASARTGLPSLRFQYRGVGASTGEREDARIADDAEAAIDHLVACDGPSIALAAYLDGARTALLLAERRPRIERLALLAPPAPSVLPPLADLELCVVLPEGAPIELRQEWSAALVQRGDSRLEVAGGPDEKFLRGLVQAARAAIGFLADLR